MSYPFHFISSHVGWNTNQGLIIANCNNWSDAYHAKVSNEDLGRLFREIFRVSNGCIQTINIGIVVTIGWLPSIGPKLMGKILEVV
jgi:hypothetical protein